MEHIGITTNNNLVISDYAHHPSEIQPTLTALRSQYPDKSITVAFQPHQYSRTIELLDGFVHSFSDADTVLVPNIYFSRDSQSDVESMPATRFVSELQKHHADTRYTKSLEATHTTLQELDTQNTDQILILMGAGDIDTIRYMNWDFKKQ